LVRRNNFLRENPTSCEIAAVWGETPGQCPFGGAFYGNRQAIYGGLTPRRVRKSWRNDTARTGA
jgi:hypothetical protein